MTTGIVVIQNLPELVRRLRGASANTPRAAPRSRRPASADVAGSGRAGHEMRTARG